MLVYIILLSQTPVVFIYSYVYFRDDKGHEPLRLLLLTFILGALACIPAAMLEGFFGVEEALRSGGGAGTLLVTAFLVGLIEEGLKYFVLKRFAYPRAAFDEPYDGIMYAVSIALGFAALENFAYVASMGISAGIERMFTAVPMHAMTGILMGYEMGRAKFAVDEKERWSHLQRSLTIPLVLHALYDFFLFFESSLMISFALIVLGYQFRITRAAMAQFAAHVPGRTAALITPAPHDAKLVVPPTQLRNATGLLWFTRAIWILATGVILLALTFSHRLTLSDHRAAVGFLVSAVVFIPLLSYVMRRLRQGSRFAWFLALAIFILFLGSPLFVIGILGLSGLLNSSSRGYFWGQSSEPRLDVTPVATAAA